MMETIFNAPLYSGLNYHMVYWKTSIVYDVVMFINMNSKEPNAISVAKIIAAFFIFFEVDFYTIVPLRPRTNETK